MYEQCKCNVLTIAHVILRLKNCSIYNSKFGHRGNFLNLLLNFLCLYFVCMQDTFARARTRRTWPICSR